MSVFRGIRAACQEVAEAAQLVHIDRDVLRSYASLLPLDEIAAPKLDPKHHYIGHGEDTAAFFLTLDAINFGSGWFPHLRKPPGLSGYFTVASALNELFRMEGPMPAECLARITAEDCTRIFGQDGANGPIQELMRHFALALNDLGRLVVERFRGSFAGLIESAEGSAERLIAQLRKMPYFDDVEIWRGRQVPFMKRAQLTAADLALAFEGRGLGRFHDLSGLTIFADNLIPHVLRIDGVLVYDCGLAARIDEEALIAPGSEAEIEIRACALHAAELMVAELRSHGLPASAMSLDYLLWNRGQLPHYKRTKPRHRTRTVYY